MSDWELDLIANLNTAYYWVTWASWNYALLATGEYVVSAVVRAVMVLPAVVKSAFQVSRVRVVATAGGPAMDGGGMVMMTGEKNAMGGVARALEEKASSARVIRLGERMFSPNGGLTGAIAEDIVITGNEMVLENFTVLSTNGGLDLLAANRQILLLAQEHGVTTLTFQGTFSNAGLAAKFGKQAGDSFSFSAPATREGLVQLLRVLK